MDSSVDNLFQKIKQSEQEALSRKSALNGLKQSIFTIQEKVKTNEREYADLQTELSEKWKELSELEFKVKVDDIQVEIYRQEKLDLELEYDKLKEKRVDLIKTLHDAKAELCCTLESLTSSYCFDESGRKLREERNKEELKSLYEEKTVLENSIQEYRDKEVEVKCLLEQKQELQQQLEEVETEKSELQSKLMVEEEQTLHLENELQIYKTKFDDNLLSIQNEVMEEKDKATKLEQQCLDLQKELQGLQQKHWQRKVQKKTNLSQQKLKPKSTLRTISGPEGPHPATSISGQINSDPCNYLDEDLETVFSDSEDFSESVINDTEENLSNTKQTAGTETNFTNQTEKNIKDEELSTHVQIHTSHKKIFRARKN